MKHAAVIAAAVTALGVFAFSSLGWAHAWHGRGDGCRCDGARSTQQSADGEGKYRMFRQESLPLRQKMMEKKFEIEKELLVSQPEKERLKKLETELDELRAKVHDLKNKYDIRGMKGGRRGHYCWN